MNHRFTQGQTIADTKIYLAILSWFSDKCLPSNKLTLQQINNELYRVVETEWIKHPNEMLIKENNLYQRIINSNKIGGNSTYKHRTQNQMVGLLYLLNLMTDIFVSCMYDSA